MANAKSTLLYIPDISGFTGFVNKTEIDHSQHIISELLEIIIESDKTGMSISEIEGDAVFFYKDDVPSVPELIDQCQTTFLNFHNHLRQYDTERICRCGACETASKLSLKFIVHQGIVNKITIKDHHKLHGADVILAHKLLKNSITEKEYILITDRFRTDGAPSKEWVSVNKASDTYKDLGKLDYSYIPIKNLLNNLKEIPQISFPGLSSDKIVVEASVNAPLEQVYDMFTNLEKRKEWNDEIRDIIHGDELNRGGSRHNCLVGQFSLDIEAIGRRENKGQLIYGERINEHKGLRDIINIYTFEKRKKQTWIKVEVDYKIESWFGKLTKSLVRKSQKKQTENVLKKLKRASEQNAV